MTATELNLTIMHVLLLHNVGSVQPRGRWRARQGEAAGGLKFTVYPRKQGDGSNSGQKLQRGRKRLPSLREGQYPDPGGQSPKNRLTYQENAGLLNPSLLCQSVTSLKRGFLLEETS